MKPQKAVVIGAGFSGLAAAITLANSGYEVTLLEKHPTPGGRARVFKKDGFTFDMGPSWYWMPDVIAGFFRKYNAEGLLPELVRLNPSYQVIFGESNTQTVPAGYTALKETFEAIEPGSGAKLDIFLNEAQQKYEAAMGKFINKPCISVTEFLDTDILKSALKLDLLSSYSNHVRRYFKSEKILQMLEFPILFLGALPKDIPALYSMMNYADIKLGTWYPMGGFGKVIDAFVKLAEQKGVTFYFDADVKGFDVSSGEVTKVITDKGDFEADVVVSSADYHFTEQLLPENYRNYTEKYWDKRVMAPSCLLYYVGINKKLGKLLHHNLFFEENFATHAHTIYTEPSWPQKPLYYVCCPGKTDASVAPEGMENIFLLIPVAPGLEDTPEIRQHYFNETIARLEQYCGEAIKPHIVSYTDYAVSDFKADYNAFKGNAYGLANTLKQTAFFKPGIRNKKIANLFYTGQLTVPGPGVPPSVISGEIVAGHIIKTSKKHVYESIV
ncbi:phytoene dehydrogenase [Flavobacterium akiainvivens]|uniref:Phytoene dehydrogenase n=1 Tax=Flavobacterium akiainvivens TaxID=1202724 RepID=A0A0M9VID3_9FLAO|nr:phytoene desaturase family protein [Flavobacterium akiainvivens]KOS06570.1 phytoene dehydrogenase [Flavobacterium akiainvivens]SFQ10268.1 phytoene desaturase [Flavobacterium akiainvivens]